MCKVDILDKTDKCPLCHNVLEWDGIEKEDLYPNALTKCLYSSELPNASDLFRPSGFIICGSVKSLVVSQIPIIIL